MIGIEYTIDEYTHLNLPKEEQPYWYPNAYSVSSGLLAAPKLGMQEYTLMNKWRNTWSRTFYTWPDPTRTLPTGLPVMQKPPLKDGDIGKTEILVRDLDAGTDTPAAKDRREPLTIRRRY